MVTPAPTPTPVLTLNLTPSAIRLRKNLLDSGSCKSLVWVQLSNWTFFAFISCGKKKSHSPLYNMIQNAMKKVWLASVQRYLLNLPYKRMLRHRSELKKKQFVVHQSKKNADCADITKIKDEKIQIF